ncbi:MAG: 4-carboxy-4-hydroxy-2-oxoadipate aldolase/oxaloacetate decarboxylase [Variibacter sp.]
MHENVVYRRVRRADPALVARAAALPVSDLYEALPNRDAALMSPRMRPLVPGLRIAGSAVTARCPPGDNLMMHRALLHAEAGDVLVVAVGDARGAQWGDLAAVYARHKGLAGVIVDGSIRDADALTALRFPVWATAISPSHPNKRAAGAVNVPVICDGARVNPGDVICADGDGALVIPRDQLAAAVEAAERRQASEGAIIAAIKAGTSLFKLHDMEDAFRASGVREIDAAWEDREEE